MDKILVTGTSSGLGRYLMEEFKGIPFHRTEIEKELKDHCQHYYDAIIHCAADTRNTIPPDDLWHYYQSNIELTRTLTKIPHVLFVYISSPAVYPYSFTKNSETDIPNFPVCNPIVIHHTYHLYGLFKLLSEQIVSRNTRTSLILRCASIVGRTSRLNTNIIKVLTSNPSSLTLRAESSYNLVSMNQIKRFIELSLAQKITGIFNTGSTQSATLGEIAQAVGSRPQFGIFLHNVHRMDTSKIRSYSEDFNKSSLEIAKEFANSIKIGQPTN